MSNLRVLIVGASIAGPTAAFWFAKAGAKVTIIERFSSLRTGGQNVDIRGIGVETMRRMPGMEDAVRSKIHVLEGLRFVDTHGRPFGTMHNSGDANQQSILSEFEIFRGDLSAILYDMTKDHPNVRYIFDEQISSIKQPGTGPVMVDFVNTTPPAEFDLVVACDGATSRTRAIGFNCGVRDHINSIHAWSAYFTIDQDLLHGSNFGHAYSAPGRFISLGKTPSGKGNCGNCISIHSADDPNGIPAFRAANKAGTDALKSYVAGRYKDAGWLSNDIIDQMMRSKDFYATEMMQVKMPRLSNGRFVLVGDAGYAAGPTGFGTSLALAGAYVLAGEISRHRGDLDAGLRAYEERMKPFLQEMQKIPPGVPAILAPRSKTLVWARNMVFALVAWGMRFGKLFSWVGGMWSSSLGQTKLRLEDYEFTNDKQ